jgi:putative hydrolase of the HAD superfamily
VRAIALDLFHTLVDPEDFRPKEFLKASAVAELLGLDTEEFVKFWAADAPDRMVTRTPPVTDRVRRYCFSHGVTPPESVWPAVTDILGKYTDLAILNPRRSIIETLGRLRDRGLVLGLISNCDEREVRAWPRSDLAGLFNATVFSCEAGAAKPSARAYQALVPRWGGIPLNDAMFVGDGNNDELAGARRAGFARVVFDSEFVSVNGLRSAEANERLRQDADTAIGHLEDLLALLDR